jgi:hypothetical protein
MLFGVNTRRCFESALLALSLAGSLGILSCKNSSKPDASPRPSAAPAEAKIRLQAMPWRVGDKTRVTRKTEMKLSVEYWQEGEKFGAQESLRFEEYAREAEVLGVVGGIPAKQRVRYERYRLKETKPNTPPHEDNSLEGQSYVVDATDRELKATFADGKRLAPEELERVSQAHGDLGIEDKIVADLKDKTIAVGAHATMRDALFRALVTTVQGDFKEGKITLSGTRQESGRQAAVFDWTAEMETHEQNEMVMTWHIKGQVVIAISPAMTLKATMSADVDVGGHTRKNGARIDMEGSGSMHDERTLTPL